MSGAKTLSIPRFEDRYEVTASPVLMTGVQALVALMLRQSEVDRMAGLRTAGFVSGYRGSPLGGVDIAFEQVARRVAEAGVKVMPAVNEELAATAVAGTQQLPRSPGARVEGVFALWYGKGPGFDRASDAIKHGHMQGASPAGGVVLAIGDDHMAKSSTLIVNSNEAAAAAGIPLFYPADASEVTLYGLHAFAISRHSGSWVGLKIVPEIADATSTVRSIPEVFRPTLPLLPKAPLGYHNRWPETPIDQETRHQLFRLPAVLDYVRANGLDQAHHRTPHSKVGIVSAGKSWRDLEKALELLGFSSEELKRFGVSLYKLSLTWPIEPTGMTAFAAGLDTLIVAEEKGPFIEGQIKSLLYGRKDAPSVIGKHDQEGNVLFSATGDVGPERIALAIAEQIQRLFPEAGLSARIVELKSMARDLSVYAAAPALRRPFFCSGCPHNRSTALPEGSRALAGIGCHGLAAYNRPTHSSFAQMGGEGVHWTGIAPFTDEPHIFANLGDGTYFHSGALAIRQAVAAKVNITYKILYNSAVAMTGGQHVDGELSVEQLAEQIRAEGVKPIVVVTEAVERYRSSPLLGKVIDRVEHRDLLDKVQQDLSKVEGVSAIIYDQMCATEKRRLRKRGGMAPPKARAFINTLVCEGCGDCSVKSNCLSVEPVDTPFGVKRQINQSSCNVDLSCLEGFCPSFVSVEGAKLRKVRAPKASKALPPPPAVAAPIHQQVLVAGIGGTGVVTIGSLISNAALLAGWETGVLDQTGLAQKGGGVLSHIHLSQTPVTALKLAPHQADLVIVADQVIANTRDVISAIDPGRTQVLVNTDLAITGDFISTPASLPPAEVLVERLTVRAGAANVSAHPFQRLAERLVGDAIGANVMMLGYASQRGWLQLGLDQISAAIDAHASPPLNHSAFEWGRRLATDEQDVYAAAGLASESVETLDQLLDRLRAWLTAYQDRRLADRFLATIAKVRQAESAIADGEQLTRSAAQSLAKLMAYKDEYEVARLYAEGSFQQALANQFDGPVKLRFHLAPPLLAPRDPATGLPRKISFGPWLLPIFRVLARMKGLRGGPLDLFGRTAERRMERALADEFEEILNNVARDLTAKNRSVAMRLAELPQVVRGYGHVKEASVRTYRQRMAEALAAFAPTGME